MSKLLNGIRFRSGNLLILEEVANLVVTFLAFCDDIIDQ